MSRRRWSFVFLAFSPWMAAGCGSSTVTPTVNAPIGSDEQLKKDLQNIAEHGTGESALEPIQMGVQALDAAHPKRAELVKAKDQLMKSPTPEKRKQIAGEMLQLLGSGQK